MGIHALAEYGDACAFVGAHQGRLLQQFCQVAVGGSIPAEDTFQRNAIDLRLVVGTVGEADAEASAATKCVIGSNGLPLPTGLTVEGQSKQANHLLTPRIHQPAGWVSALMTLEAAPTPCSRTGFHMINSSLWVPGSTMIRSPGAAASIAD